MINVFVKVFVKAITVATLIRVRTSFPCFIIIEFSDLILLKTQNWIHLPPTIYSIKDGMRQRAEARLYLIIMSIIKNINIKYNIIR